MKYIASGLTCCLILLTYSGCLGVTAIGSTSAAQGESSGGGNNASGGVSSTSRNASSANARGTPVDFDSVVGDALTRMDNAFKASEEITPAGEYYIGRAVAANILSKYRIYSSDTDLIIYVNKVLMTLSINSPRPNVYNGYHAIVLDSEEVNAFATPGGHVFITRGLLACANSEDALAAVLAHELAHIQLYHGIDSIKDQRFTGALHEAAIHAADVAMEAAGVPELTRIFDGSIREMMTTLITNGYTQEQEFQADIAALSLLADAGYRPSAILDMLNAMKQNGQRQQNSGFVKTHPTADSRINNVNKFNSYRTPETQQFRKARFDALKR